MSNERIDLTQFAGMTEGEWCYDMDAEWEDTEWYNDLTCKVPEDRRAEYAENTRKAYEKGQRDGLEPYLSPLIEQLWDGENDSTFGVRIFRGLLRGNEHDEFISSDSLRSIPTPSEIRANARAIAAVPKLIAELDRCYEEIDDLKRQYQSCTEALRDTTDWVVRMVDAIDSGKMSEIKRVRNS